MIGEQPIRLPKGPWLFNGEDSGELSPAVSREQHNREVLLQAGVDEATMLLGKRRAS